MMRSFGWVVASSFKSCLYLGISIQKSKIGVPNQHLVSTCTKTAELLFKHEDNIFPSLGEI